MADVSGVASVIQREHDAVAAETKIGQCPPLVATNDMENAAHLPSRLRSQHETKVKPLANAEGEAYVVDCPTLKSTVLWVATNNDSYRAEYLTFLNATYGLGLSSIPKPYDVDHLYNQTRAKGYGLKYLRLALVGYTPNRSHGAAYEKDLTRNEAARDRRDMKWMDEITSMKYFGFLSPLRDDPRESEVAAYVAFAASKLGLDPVEVRKSIELLRRKASTPWARK
jgi:hypothetical protein